MKKTLSIVLCFMFIFSVSFGQNTGEETKTITAVMPDANFLNQVNVFFCNDGFESKNLDRNINTPIAQLEEKEVCVLFNNDSDTDLNIWTKFPSGTLTTTGDPACLGGDKGNFKDFVTPEWKGDIKVPAKSYVVRQFKVKFPIGVKGVTQGCLAYGVSDEMPDPTKSMVTVISSKTNFMDFFVGDVGDIENKVELRDFNIEKNEKGEIKIKASVYNIGNVDSSLTVTGNIASMFGYNETFSFEGYEVNAKKDAFIESSWLSLPAYKGLFDITLDIAYTPSFDFDVSDFDLDEDLLKGDKITINESYFEMPRIYLGGAVLIIILLLFAFRKKKPAQVVYVQQPQQVPPVQ